MNYNLFINKFYLRNYSPLRENQRFYYVLIFEKKNSSGFSVFNF